MALPVTIPNEFASATASIPLSQLDTNFTTLANAVNGISDGSESLANVSVTGGTISNVAVSATTLNTSGQVVFNDAGADVDFRVEGDTDVNLLFVDASADSVGIGTSSPSYPLQVIKNQAATTNISVDNNTGNAASHASLILHTGGASSGDPFVYFYNEITDWSIGCDNSDSDKFKISKSSTLGTNDYFNIDASGNVGIGTTEPSFAGGSSGLMISGVKPALRLSSTTVGSGSWEIYADSASTGGLGFYERQNGQTKMYIDEGGNVLVGTTATSVWNSSTLQGVVLEPNAIQVSRSGEVALLVNRITDDGQLVRFAQAGVEEGNISVSGSTVSYNGGHLSRYAQTITAKDESLKKGTIFSNLDEMNVYVKPTLYWTEKDELPVDEEGNPTVAVGDVKQETSVSENEQLNKVKVSDVEGDANVAGVFVNWTYDEAHQVDEINMAMTGDMIIRIAEGVTVARGDLLMSAGDGTAKPQGDDIVRSKTIAKVTSTHVTCTYEDGSYCVPCVLMAC
jgi:hypothetical protein